MTTQRFDATIEPIGTRAGVVLPFDPNAVWDAKPNHHITGTVGGCTVRGALACDGGRWFLALGPVWRRDSGLDPAARVAVELWPEGPQVDALADDIAAAIVDHPAARSFFEGLATFYRKGFVDWIEAAKRPATRAARIAEMVKCLKAERRQR